MSTPEAIFLGILQGITEFLPISSSGHLVLAQHLIGLKEPPVLYDVLLHLATLLATVIVLQGPVWEIVKSVPRLPAFLCSLFSKGRLAVGDDPWAWLALLIVISTVVTGVIGVVFHKFFLAGFSSLRSTGIGLAVTGFLLFFSRGRPKEPSKTASRTTIADSVLIGAAQGVAILPGISRSGATITAGLFVGFDRRLAGEYAFLMSIPAILGATFLETRSGFGSLDVPPLGVLAGFLSALLVGALFLRLLLAWVRSGRLHLFAFYCWGLSLIVIVLSLRS
jgi:undecaprenyl-diphosphatase